MMLCLHIGWMRITRWFLEHVCHEVCSTLITQTSVREIKWNPLLLQALEK